MKLGLKGEFNSIPSFVTVVPRIEALTCARCSSLAMAQEAVHTQSFAQI